MIKIWVLILICFGVDYAEAQACLDRTTLCPSWRSSCSWNNYVKQNCKRTCGLCSQSPGCSNRQTNRNCVFWANNGACQKNFQYMKKNCQLTCNLCPKTVSCFDLNKYCPDWKKRGECEKNPTYMRKNCKKSCNLCSSGKKPTRATTTTTTTTTTTKRPPVKSLCLDENKDCKGWSENGECKKNPEYMLKNCKRSCGVCQVVTKPPQETTTPKPTPTKNECTDLNEDCKKWSEEDECKKNPDYMMKNCKKSCGGCSGPHATLLPHVKEILKCGINKYNDPFSKFVVGGEISTEGEWIWQAAIYNYDIFSCGGTLISPQYVLTAAHCLNDGADIEKEGLDIVLGDHTRDKKDKDEQRFKVEKFWIHSDYGNRYKLDMNADIALIKLDRPAIISSKVGVACLPESNRDVDINARCYISGWGKMSAEGTTVNVLQDAKLPIVSNTACGKHNTDYRGQSAVNENMLCAGSVTKNIGGCNGDSGGPFVCTNKKGQWVVEGAVSWGSSQCDSREMYTVFVRVSKYLNWIKQRMN